MCPEKTMIQKVMCTLVFTAALFAIARTCKQPRCHSTDEWIKMLGHIYTMKYHSANRKEQIWVSWIEVDKPRAFHSEWAKSGSEKQILYINTYVWNLEKYHWWTSVEGRNRNTDVENKLENTVGEGEGGRNWDSSIETCIAMCRIDDWWKAVL